ncbi:hypothetical protein [Gaoshiqia sp. Z1-71]|uniref:hypothetical protein n=1 Tax=Gaoshiqia hydrogeniformans TaxID=3290090 RepID=UPI003BF86931
MKQKGLFITTILFFLIINTTYFWEGKLGFFAFPVLFLLVIVYLILVFLLLRQFFFAFREKFIEKQRLVIIGTLLGVLTVTLLKPNGLINFDKLQGKDLLVAEREGAANCMTTLKLKENNKFTERIVCFGVTELKGNYELKGDTIFFKYNGKFRHKNGYHKFGVIQKFDTMRLKYLGDIVMYKSLSDTTGLDLWITKNELTQ